MHIVTSSVLADVFEIQAGIGLALFAAVIFVLVRALLRERRAPHSFRLNKRSYR